MKHITQAEANTACALHANNNTLTVAQVQQLLGNVSVTFATIEYVTAVQTAAAHKGQNIKKVTKANVILCSNIAAHTSVYANKVKKTAATIASNDQAAVAAFTPQANYFEHTACHSIVQHKAHADKFYLYVIYNDASSVFMRNGTPVTKQDIIPFLTPSGARDLMAGTDVVENKTHGIKHKVAVRTIALSNIVSIKARKQFVTV